MSLKVYPGLNLYHFYIITESLQNFTLSSAKLITTSKNI